MAQDKWTNTFGGDFATAANWSTGVVPGASDDALLTTAGTYTVTSSASETVNSIQVTQHVTLAITGGTFDAINGSGSGTDNGVISLVDNTQFEFGGTLAGSGTVAVNGTYYGTNIIINSATATLSGGGTIALGDFGGNRFYAATAGDRLVNTSDTISGAGLLGDGNMAITNAAGGVINANAAANSLVLNVGTYGVSNAGLIEATGSAGLVILSSTVTQTGTGTLKAINSEIYLENATIVGGAVSSTGTGELQVAYGNYAELNGVKIAAASMLRTVDNATLYLDNTINNLGTIFQDGTYYGANLDINSAAVTLTGGGALNLLDYGGTRINASVPGNKLVNLNNIISGSGQFGNASGLAFDNRAAGIVNSNGAAGLTFYTSGLVTNEGLIEDTGVGGLGFNATTLTNTGTLGAFGAGSHVDLYGNSAIVGGLLETTGGGIIDVAYSSNGTLDGSTHANPITITAGSTVQLDDNSSLEINGSIVNNGTIFQEGTYYGSNLVVNTPTVTLSGGGKIVMTDVAAVSRIVAAGTTGFKLVNIDNTIMGSGQIGNGSSLAIDNQLGGTINSNGTSGLTISTVSGLTNEGLIEDTGTGSLFISATTVTNTSTIAAYGSGSQLNLGNGADIIGGTLVTTGGGFIQNVTGGATLDGLTSGAIMVAANSTFQNLDNQYLNLDGTITNKGTIVQAGTYYGAVMLVNSATVTLNGGGTLRMSDLGNNRIYTNTPGYKLVNVNNTIVGSGQIGYGTGLLIDNQLAGVINSSGAAGLTISSTAGVTNEGLIEDTGLGTLFINATTVNNTGTIAANGSGSVLNLGNGTDIIGGTLATSGGGVIQNATGGATLDGLTAGAITLTTGSTFQNIDNQYLYLDGTITNHGTISQAGTYYGSVLIVNSATVTLNGGGTLLMSDLGNNRTYTNTAGYKFVNVDNKIIGSGQIGYGTSLLIDNQALGIINSNGLAGLTISSTAAVTNEGLIEDTNTGSLAISSTTVTNTGTIAAYGAGTQVSLVSAVIDGGTLATTGGGVIAAYNSSSLDGSTAAGAITVATGSTVEFLDNQSFYLAGTITNHGTIFQDGTYYGTQLYINSPTVTLTGGGTLVLSDFSNNNIYASVAGDKLVNFNNEISGAGQFGNGAGLALDNQASGLINATGGNNLDINLGAKFTNEGTAEGSGSGGLYIQQTTLTNTGTIAALSGSSVTISNTTTVTNYNAGTLTGGTWEAIAGTGSSTLSIASGTISTDDAHLVISGVGASIIAGGTSVLTTIATIGTTGELDIQNGATFTAANPLAVSGTILLSGSLSSSAITTTTKGLISANGGLGTVSTTGRLLNNGTLQATTGGTLSITGGSLNNVGTVVAQAGGIVATSATERVTNYVGGTLTGGTWAAVGNGATLSIGIGVVTTDAATLTLSGAGSSIRSGASARQLDATLTSVAATGVLNVLNSRGFASGAVSGLADNGIISLGGVKFSASGVTIASGATFQGGGTLASTVTDTGLLASSAIPLGSNGTLTVTGAISGTGLLSATAATTLNTTAGYAVGTISVAAGATFTGAGSASGAVTVAGTLAVGTTGTLSAGTLTVQSTGLVSGPNIVASGAIADSGSISLAGGTLSGGSISVATTTAALTGYGTVVQNVVNTGTIAAAGGTLTLTAGETGGTVIAGASATLATQSLSATKLTVDAGGAFIGAGTAASVIDAGTLTASGGLLTLAANAGAGTAVIAGGATLDSTSTLTISGLSFGTGSSQTLELATPSGNTSLISNWGGGDTIDLLNTTVTAFTYAPGAGLLTLRDFGTAVGTLTFAGSYTRANFSLASDGHGGTDVTFVTTASLVADPMTDLQAAVAASSGSAQAVGLTTPASLPAALPTVPSLGGSFGVGVQSEQPFDAHFALQ